MTHTTISSQLLLSSELIFIWAAASYGVSSDPLADENAKNRTKKVVANLAVAIGRRRLARPVDEPFSRNLLGDARRCRGPANSTHDSTHAVGY